jgi:hypothetical protein
MMTVGKWRVWPFQPVQSVDIVGVDDLVEHFLPCIHLLTTLIPPNTASRTTGGAIRPPDAMSSQPQLLPSLYALLPPSSHALLVARLSLQSIHIEPYHMIESTYIAESTVIPNQPRSLRLQALRRGGFPSGVEGVWDKGKGTAQAKGKGKGKSRAEPEYASDELGEAWEYKLSYLSSPLSGREYAEMNVRACMALDIVGMTARAEIEDFIETLGFRWVVAA